MIQRKNGDTVIFKNVEQCLTLSNSGCFRRLVNGELIHTGGRLGKYTTTLQIPGSNESTGVLDIGEMVTLDSVQRLSETSFRERLTLTRPFVPTSLCAQGVDGTTISITPRGDRVVELSGNVLGKSSDFPVRISYRPRLSMMVTGRTHTADEWGDRGETVLTLDEI